jgi:hypothetical protein
MHREEIYVNGGELYKSTPIWSEDTNNPYIYDGMDPVFEKFKSEDGVIKRYLSTHKLRKFVNKTSKAPSADMSYFDLCPAVSFWGGFGARKNGTVDLYFDCKNSATLKAVADYYKLVYPISEEMSEDFDANPDQYALFFNGEERFTLGSVKLINGTPVLLKFHAVYKDFGKYFYFNRGRVFSKGKVIEEGGWYKAHNLPDLYISQGEGFSTEYRYAKTNDPLVNFEGVVTYEDGTTAIKSYESSLMVRQATAGFDLGSNFPEYHKAPHVKWWIGRSILKNEEELYFHVENTKILNEVCWYYGLEVPYTKELRKLIDNDPTAIRFKSEDLEQKGPGKFVEILLASVVFVDKVPVGIKFYETTRPVE